MQSPPPSPAPALRLSIAELFRTHLPSFEEGLSAAGDEELKSMAMLVKMFARGQEGDDDYEQADAEAPAPPALMRPRSLLLSGTHGTGKQAFVRALAALFGLHLHTLSFGRLILRKGVAGQTDALRAELAELRQRFMHSHVAGTPKCLLLVPSLELTFASGGERDEDAMSMQTEMIAFMRELQQPGQTRIMIVGVTSERSRVATALMRAFQFRFKVHAPSDVGRARIIAAHLGLPTPVSGDASISNTLPSTSVPAPVPAAAAPFDATAVDVHWVAEQTQGFVGADLVSLIKTAVDQAVQRTHSSGEAAVTDMTLRLTNADFQHALARIHPASLKALQVVAKPRSQQLPPPSSVASTLSSDAAVSTAAVAAPSNGVAAPSTVTAPLSQHQPQSFSSVGGLDSVKTALRESLLWPFRHRAALRKLVVAPSSGMLLYGVPGVGKTMLCRAVAAEFRVNFLAVRLQDLLSSGVGESEKRVVDLFTRARALAPAVLFLDEVQAIFASGAASAEGGGSDDNAKMMAQLLAQLDALNEEQTGAQTNDNTPPPPPVFVLAATNLPWALDPALLRSGRLDRVLYVPPPDAAARAQIMRLARGQARWSEAVHAGLDALAARTEGFSAVDVVHLVGRAGLCAAKRICQTAGMAPSAHTAAAMEVRPEDFEEALRPGPGAASASITPDMIEACTSWGRKWQNRHAMRRQLIQADEALQAAIKADD